MPLPHALCDIKFSVLPHVTYNFITLSEIYALQGPYEMDGKSGNELGLTAELLQNVAE